MVDAGKKDSEDLSLINIQILQITGRYWMFSHVPHRRNVLRSAKAAFLREPATERMR